MCKYNYHFLSVEATFDKRNGNAAHLIRRALPLVEAISREFNNTLLRLAYTPYPTFKHLLVRTTTRGVTQGGDDLIRELTDVVREARRGVEGLLR